MHKYFLLKKNSISTIMFAALFLRILFLLIIWIAGDYGIPTNIITDDVTYEMGAKAFLTSASGVFDISAYKIGFLTNSKPFYPWFVCIVSYIFKTVWAARLVNVFISVFCCNLIYKLLLYFVSDDCALVGAKLYAFLPYPLMMSCFITKDVFLTFVFLYVLLTVERIKDEGIFKIKRSIIISILIMIAGYFTRGGMVESLLILEGIYLVIYLFREGKTKWALALIFIGTVILWRFGNSIVDAFSTKISDYSDYERGATSIAALRIDSITQIWKLPFTYAFALLQPLKLSFSNSGSSFWLQCLLWLNYSMVPVAITNLLYMFFCKKKYRFFYWSNIILFCSVIILVLNVFRHYFFLLPIAFINYALFEDYIYEHEMRNIKLSRFLVSLIFIGLMLLYIIIF